jgi:hypothetical protein
VADPPICKTCNTAHWPFRKQDCLGPPEAEPPQDVLTVDDPTTLAPSGVFVGPLPEGLRAPEGFGQVEQDSFTTSAAKLGFGTGEAGWQRPPRRS